ncbi:HD domain-containing protein [Aminipila sp.]|uniref:HD domain-containing protein n=1 Tax=Aminipila sp. TaxID=2060095 RepID=UPI001DD5A30D|nr:HD domain-containing protein [Aminipila sp.]MBE6034001.1 HD domain-containing protein [Clostridiales bacterium]
MKFVDKLIKNPVYIESLKEIEAAERERVFCCHGIAHFMDVARIAYIYNLEQELGLEKEMIYLAALLHDIGRAEEYNTGVPHEQASKKLAVFILSELDYPREKFDLIIRAIENHRNREIKELYSDDPSEQLNVLINMADKQSRNCFFCSAYEMCNWSEDKKNKFIIQ